MLHSCKLKRFLNRGYIDIIYNETFYGNHTITLNQFCMRKKKWLSKYNKTILCVKANKRKKYNILKYCFILFLSNI